MIILRPKKAYTHQLSDFLRGFGDTSHGSGIAVQGSPLVGGLIAVGVLGLIGAIIALQFYKASKGIADTYVVSGHGHHGHHDAPLFALELGGGHHGGHRARHNRRRGRRRWTRRYR